MHTNKHMHKLFYDAPPCRGVKNDCISFPMNPRNIICLKRAFFNDDENVELFTWDFDVHLSI